MKFIYIILFTLLAATTINSYEVDMNILENSKSIEFDNYVGPYKFYNTVEDIRGIGAYLAKQIEPGVKKNANYGGKYLMYHYPRLEWELEVNSCDVFTITKSAQVDNIENIKLILSQYLMDNYGYNLEDSLLISQLLVIYNAVYRGDSKHFLENYTSESANGGNSELLGIDLHYYNWPGKTNIYIPLSEGIISGNLSNIDTDEILEPEIIEYIKAEEDDDITIREDIVDFKEREFDEIKKDIVEEKIALIEEKEEIEKQIKHQDKLLEVENSDVEDKGDNLVDDNIKKKSESEDSIDRPLSGDKFDLKKKQDLEEELKATKKKIEKVEKKEKELEKKESKILEIRDGLAIDKTKEIKSEKNINNGDIISFILNREYKKETLGQLINIDISGNIVLKGSVNTIRNSFFHKEGEYLYLIAGGEDMNQIITICKIKQSNLEMVKWSKTDCYKKSPIFSINNFLYCIIREADDYFIGEFDKELNLIRKSASGLDKDSYIVLKGETFYIQGNNNSIKLLNLSEFTHVVED